MDTTVSDEWLSVSDAENRYMRAESILECAVFSLSGALKASKDIDFEAVVHGEHISIAYGLSWALEDAKEAAKKYRDAERDYYKTEILRRDETIKYYQGLVDALKAKQEYSNNQTS